jgi:hypothetical protein
VRAREYLLERGGSHLYIFYSTLGQNLATVVPILYSLTASRGQVRFDINTKICRFQVLVIEPNTITCHDASEVYGYSCFIAVVEELASKSC